MVQEAEKMKVKIEAEAEDDSQKMETPRQEEDAEDGYGKDAATEDDDTFTEVRRKRRPVLLEFSPPPKRDSKESTQVPRQLLTLLDKEVQH